MKLWDKIKKWFFDGGAPSPTRTPECPSNDELDFYITEPYSDDPQMEKVAAHVRKCPYCRTALGLDFPPTWPMF